LAYEPDLTILFAVTYVMSIAAFATVIIYPLFKETSREIFSPLNPLFSLLPILFTIIALGYGFFMMYFMMTYFISLLLLFVSMFSGFEAFWKPKAFIADVLLLSLSTLLSAVPMLSQDVAVVATSTLLNIAIYTAGVIEGASKHVLPLAKSMYMDFGSGEGWAYAFTSLFVLICVLTLTAKLIAATIIPDYLQVSISLSDAVFLLTGVTALITRKLREKTKPQHSDE